MRLQRCWVSVMVEFVLMAMLIGATVLLLFGALAYMLD